MKRERRRRGRKTVEERAVSTVLKDMMG